MSIFVPRLPACSAVPVSMRKAVCSENFGVKCFANFAAHLRRDNHC
jgi:hypothetical protein